MLSLPNLIFKFNFIFNEDAIKRFYHELYLRDIASANMLYLVQFGRIFRKFMLNWINKIPFSLPKPELDDLVKKN